MSDTHMPRALLEALAVALISAAIAVLALPSVAGACATVAVRFGDHPAYVRVVVDFVAGTITPANVNASGPDPYRGRAVVRVARPGIVARISKATGLGVTVRIDQERGALRLQLTAARGRFKYLSYTVPGGTHLAIDLWKSKPPSKPAEIRRGAGGCLSIVTSSVDAGVVTASGGERGVFEHQFALVLRGAGGQVLGQSHVLAIGARWSARLTYHTTRRQPGTLEAVAASPKDGSLACIAQIRVVVAPSIAITRLSADPARCLRRVSRVAGAGVVAALGGNEITIAPPTGGVRTVVPVSTPPQVISGVRTLQWSRDGRYLAARDGSLWTGGGQSAGRLFASPVLATWSWSSTSDCAIGLTQVSDVETTLSLGVPGQSSRPFLRGRLGAFALSPSGRALYLTAGDATFHEHFFRIDLSSGAVRDIAALPLHSINVIFGGWAPGGHILLFWAGMGASIMADGWGLEGLDTGHGNRIVRYGTSTDPAVAAVQYHNGGATAGPAPASIVSVKTGATRYLSPTTTMTESNPQWTESGIVYGRAAPGTSTAALWFAQYGAGARDTGLRGVTWACSSVAPDGVGG